MWAYIQCPACYEAERILRIPKPVSADLMIGRFAHAALADMRTVLMSEDAPEHFVHGFDRYLEVGSQAFDEVITRQVDVDDEGDETPIEVELTKKFTDLGQAKDAAVSLTRFALPKIAAYDARAGVLAAEARVWHLGPSVHGYPDLYAKLNDDEKIDADEEAQEQSSGDLAPAFPFPMKAFLDVIYRNGVLKDAKTSSRNGSPDNLAAIQLLLYGMPWWKAGQAQKLGWDVMIKTKSPDVATYWWRGDGVALDEDYQYVHERVMQAADDICAGRFPANNGSLFCHYMHLGGRGERAVEDNWSPIAVPA